MELGAFLPHCLLRTLPLLPKSIWCQIFPGLFPIQQRKIVFLLRLNSFCHTKSYFFLRRFFVAGRGVTSSWGGGLEEEEEVVVV